MPFKVDYKKLGKINWYRQGGAIRLFYVFVPFYSINETIGYDRIVLYQEENVNTAFFDRDLEGKKFRWALDRQAKDKKFIDKWISAWAARNEKMIGFARNKLSRSVDLWSDVELRNFLDKFNELCLKTWKKGVMLEWSDPDGHNILSEYVRKSGVQLSEKEVDISISPAELTFKQREFISRIKIAGLMAGGKNAESLLEKHAEEFHCYENTWADVKELDAEKGIIRMIK